jgi:hypothetical protein
MLLLPDPVHPLDVHLSAPEGFRAGQHTMRALTPMPRERLHDLSHHTEQLPVTVNLPGTVTLRAAVLAEDSTDPSFRDLSLPQGPPDGFHRPTATLGARQLSCATPACGRAASQVKIGGSACPGLDPPPASSASSSPSGAPEAVSPHRCLAHRRHRNAGRARQDSAGLLRRDGPHAGHQRYRWPQPLAWVGTPAALRWWP